MATLQTAVLAYQAVNKRKKTNQMKQTVYAAERSSKFRVKNKICDYMPVACFVLQTDSGCLADKVKTVQFKR